MIGSKTRASYFDLAVPEKASLRKSTSHITRTRSTGVLANYSKLLQEVIIIIFLLFLTEPLFSYLGRNKVQNVFRKTEKKYLVRYTRSITFIY